jgi:hypothetical protein
VRFAKPRHPSCGGRCGQHDDRAHQDRFGLDPERLAADSGYASAEIPFWLVHEHGIEPHIPASMSSGARTGPSNGTTPATARLNVDRRRELGDLKMIMSVVKSLAHMALGTLLIAIGPASMSVSDAQDLASAHGDMPIKQLKDVYLDCEREAAASALGTDDVMYCSMAYEELKRREFHGNFERIRVRTEAQGRVESTKAF